MLVIRQSQMDALSQGAMRRFEDDLIGHFRQHLPAHHAQLGDEGTREAIRHGVQRARAYGIESEPDVAVYVRHMFLFGRDFDVDPQLPWAAHALTQGPVGSGAARVGRLAQASLAYLRALAREQADAD